MKKSLSLLMLGMFMAFLSLPLARAAEHGGTEVQEHGGTAVEPAAPEDEDTNKNGVLDEGEDKNGNGVLDTAKKAEAAEEEEEDETI